MPDKHDSFVIDEVQAQPPEEIEPKDMEVKVPKYKRTVKGVLIYSDKKKKRKRTRKNGKNTISI
jgi:hypothetical protein